MNYSATLPQLKTRDDPKLLHAPETQGDASDFLSKSLPFSQRNQPNIPPNPSSVPTPQQPSASVDTHRIRPPPATKNSGMKVVLTAGIVLMLLSLAPVILFVSNRNKRVAEIRSKAGTGICCEGGTCEDGWSYGSDLNDTVHGSCEERRNDACKDHTGPGTRTGGGACATGGGAGEGGQTVQCTDSQGRQGETCTSLDTCDVAGGCNPACGPANGVRDDGQICDVPNGYCQSGYSCRPSTVGQHQKMIDGKCVWQLCDNGAASCPDDPGCTGQGGTGGGNQNCKEVLQTCSESQPCCEGQNLVCQNPTGGARVCQQTAPGGSGDSFCDTGGKYTCDRVRAHRCSSLNAQGQCNENGTNSADWSAGVRYANGCGQVDMVCNGGPKDGQLCGGYEIIKTSCTTAPLPTASPTPTPAPTPSPTPTPTPVAGTCESLLVYDMYSTDITAAIRDQTKKLAPSETIILAVPKGNATKARFRIQGASEWTENDPTLTTASEYRLAITIPSTMTQALGTLEGEVFMNGQWR